MNCHHILYHYCMFRASYILYQQQNIEKKKNIDTLSGQKYRDTLAFNKIILKVSGLTFGALIFILFF